MRPIQKEPATETTSVPAVMATRPARPPFSVMETSGLPYFTQVRSMVVTAPAAAAMFVVTMMLPTERIVSSPVMETVEPPLKPNQPIHRMNMPRQASVME